MRTASVAGSVTMATVCVFWFCTVEHAVGVGILDETVYQEINCQSPDHQGQSCWLLSFGGTEIAELQLDHEFPSTIELSQVRYSGPTYAGVGVPTVQASGNTNTLQNVAVTWNPPSGTDLVYDSKTGGFSVVTTDVLTTLELISNSSVFTGECQNQGGLFDVCRPDKIFKLEPTGFGSLDFGHSVRPGLTAAFLAQDLMIAGSPLGGGKLENVDIREPIFRTMFEVELFDPRPNLGPRSPVAFTLLASDDNDFIGFTNGTELRGPAEFTSIELQYRYDFNGDSKRTADDIDAMSDALRADPLIVYHPVSGGLSVQAKTPLTTLEIISKGSIFNGQCRGLDGLFDICRPDKIFRLEPFGFGSYFFGNVTRPGLSVYSLKQDLSFNGSPVGGGIPKFVGPVIDVNNDGQFNAFDRQYYIEQVLNTFFGDANLDGEFNTSDLIEIFIAGEYEDAIPGNSTWAEGDWSGDRDFDSTDLILAFAFGGFEVGPRPADGATAVPEASAVVLLLSASVLYGRAWRQGRRLGRRAR